MYIYIVKRAFICIPTLQNKKSFGLDTDNIFTHNTFPKFIKESICETDNYNQHDAPTVLIFFSIV